MSGRKNNKVLKIISILGTILLFAGCATLLNVREGSLAHVQRLYRRGEKESAFFELRRLARDNTNLLLAWKAQFGLGEYYFECHANQEATNCFLTYLTDKNFSSSKSLFLALAKLYLYKISRPGSESIPKEIKIEFFSQPIFLLFSEYKYKKYISPLGHKYEVREYPQKVEVYLDGKLFQTLTP